MSNASEPDPETAGVSAGSADQIYSAPAAAQAEAQRVIADPASSDADRSEALATLGRSAYYDNRIHEAVTYLEGALPLTADPSRQVEIALTLAPALSKEGRSVEALALLDFPDAGLSLEQAGKAHNQRGIILIELGRLPEAVEAFEQARNSHRNSGYFAGEGRALINMAAATSEIGDQDRALELYEEAWRLTTETDQAVMNAMIEGNLGYVASRRGDFGVALSWYQRARASFSGLGGVDLLTAVLEVDHATTLLDLGLNNDAYEAAEYARQSSASGSNRMLEVQALLLLGEAQVRLQQYRIAEKTLAGVRESALELDVRPWELRCDYLLHRLSAVDDDSAKETTNDEVLTLAIGLRDAAWHRESLRTIVLAARKALDRGDSDDARSLLEWAAGDDSGDLIDRHHAEALRAFIDDDPEEAETALAAGFAEIDRQRQLLGSAEFHIRLGHRAADLRTMALRAPLRSGDASAALVAHSRGRPQGDRSVAGGDELRSQLRDARVGLQEARLGGRPTDDLEGRIGELEDDLTAGTVASHHQTFDAADRCRLVNGAVVVVYIQHQGTLWAVRAIGELELFDLGPVSAIESAVRAQRSGLRRMAVSEETDTFLDRTEAANLRLDEVLIAPLTLPPGLPVVVVPDGALGGVSWSGLPTLAERTLTVAPSVRALNGWSDTLPVSRVGLLGGPDLLHAAEEIDEVSALWCRAETVAQPMASVSDAMSSFTTCDVVHVAAHGTFRPDNPLFSTLTFHDRALTVFEFEGLEQLPSLVVLASCDSGAVGAGGSGPAGTAQALLTLGVDVVVAPTVIVDDGAARRFVVDFHSALVAGDSIDTSVSVARRLAFDRKTAVDVAAAQAFQAHGSNAAWEKKFHPAD